MTELNNPQAQQLIAQAYRAVRLGQRTVARQLAEAAVAVAPNLEDPYLILAAISDPLPAMEFLKKALEINPSSQRARNGMQWAIQKMRSSNQPAGQAASPVTPAPENPTAAPATPAMVGPAGIPTGPVVIPPLQAGVGRLSPLKSPNPGLNQAPSQPQPKTAGRS